MNQRDVDKRTGYFLLFLCVFIISGVFAIILKLQTNPSQIWTASIERAGALKIDDPVKVQGYTIGKITDMQPTQKAVFISIAFSHPVTIYSNYELKMAEKGVFGKRFFTLFPGDSTANRLDSSKDTLKAQFLPGISDVMGQAWKLEKNISRISLLLKNLEHGTGKKASFQKNFNEIIQTVDSLTDKVDQSLALINKNISQMLDSVRIITSITEDKIKTLAALSPELISKLNESLVKFMEIVENTQKSVRILMNMTESLDEHNSIKQNEKLENIMENLNELKKTLKDLKDNSGRLKLRISRLKE